jgi:DNA polymerase delta subunit 1
MLSIQDYYEVNIEASFRLMVDRGLIGGGWFRVNDWELEPAQKMKLILTRSIDIVPLPDRQDNAPLSILSIDAEMTTCDGLDRFPEAKLDDPVIQIACVTWLLGRPDSVRRIIFVLGSCDSVESANQTCVFSSESALLEGFGTYMATLQPDIATGYNSNSFDWPYIMERARSLDVHIERADCRGAVRFQNFGKLPFQAVTCLQEQRTSNQRGTRDSVLLNSPGLAFVDTLEVMRSSANFRSYKLDYVAKQTLGAEAGKDGVAYSEIPWIQNHGSSKDRARLAKYCIQDAELVRQIADKRLILINLIEMARVIGILIKDVFAQGQTFKILRLIMRHALPLGYLIPTYDKGSHGANTTAFTHVPYMTEIQNREGSYLDRDPTKSYQGAHVISPRIGFYQEPVVVLDFASLYPSIMSRYNLSYDTLLRSEKEAIALDLKPEDYEITPAGNVFVREKKKRGLLPIVLNYLLDARAAAKKQMKTADSAAMRAVYDGKQLALKINANSIYGFTGAQVGPLPCRAIAESVTGFGRQMLEATATFAKQKFSATTVYGDTDSVFLTFPNTMTVDAALNKAHAMSDLIHTKDQGIFDGKHVVLEVEKAFYPFVIFGKKRYCGFKYEVGAPKGHRVMDMKGLQAVRRDNALLCAELQTAFLTQLLDLQPRRALDLIVDTIEKLFQGQIPNEKLTISKKWSKAEYATPQIHVVLAHKIALRTPGLAPRIGDRIGFLVVRRPIRTPFSQQGEDPAFVLANGLPLDLEYYYQKQIYQPLYPLLMKLLGAKRAQNFFHLARNHGGLHDHYKNNVCDTQRAWIERFTKFEFQNESAPSRPIAQTQTLASLWSSRPSLKRTTPASSPDTPIVHKKECKPGQKQGSLLSFFASGSKK